MVPTLCRCRQAARCRAVLWVAFFAAWHVAVVQSCSDVTMFNTTMYDALISARNYDFFAQKVLTLQFSVIPEGTDIQYTPLTGCTSPQGLSESQRRSKYSWICVSVGRPELLAGFGIGCEGRFDGRSFGECQLGQPFGLLGWQAACQHVQPVEWYLGWDHPVKGYAMQFLLQSPIRILSHAFYMLGLGM